MQIDVRISALAHREVERKGRRQEAGQIPNPSIEAESAFNSEGKQTVTLLQPIELGGKRAARIDVSASENSLSEVEDQSTRAEVASGVAQSLARHRQLKTRMSLMEETRGSLENSLRRLRLKAVRTPEEKSAVTIFSLQSTLIETQILSIRRDLKEVRTDLEASIGRKLGEQEQLSSIEKKTWPILANLNNVQTFESRVAVLGTKKAESEWRMQKSQSWPDLAVGPTFERDNAKGEAGWGAKVSLSIPLFHANGGARERTQAEYQRMETLARQTSFREEENLRSLSEQYQELASFLKTSPSQNTIQKSVGESLLLFSRGMIQPAAVIETYRTALETLEAVQEKELTAFRLYWRLQSIAGQVPQEFL